MLSSDKSNMFVSMKVHLASVYEKILSSMKVILSKILILKSIVCCVCVMFSSDVSWGMDEKEDEFNDEPPTYSVVLLGDEKVGKTQIMEKKIKNTFEADYKATIGVDFGYLDVQIKQDNPEIKLKVIDTAGQEGYRNIIKCYFKTCDAFVLVYDITNQESFENIQTWINLAKDNAGKEAVYFLVGNKADMENGRKVTKEDTEKYTNENKMTFCEVSAQYGTNIDKLFEAIANACFDNDPIKKIKNESIENPENKYTKKLIQKDQLKLHELENKKKNMQTPPPSKNKRCNCCPCCNKDEEDKKKETKSPKTQFNLLTDDIN